MTTTAGARERLRRRQSAVLAEVMAGRVPVGFDERTTRVTGIVLRSRRRRAAVRVLPLLAAVPDLPEVFDRYAATHPPAGCAHDDADAFASWTAAAGALGPAGAAWRVREVELGRRRAAVAGRGRRRRLVVGVGRWVYEIGSGRGA